MKLCISLVPGQVTRTTGIGQVILAQWRYLPEYGINPVSDYESADLSLCHIAKPASWPNLDLVQIHGCYWHDTPHLPFAEWHRNANAGIVSSVKHARKLIVPSQWVAMPFKRDMRIDPAVIPHGIDPEEWQPGTPQDYILYNKNRESDVCQSDPALSLAEEGFPVVSTFAPRGKVVPSTMKLTGVLPFSEMKPIIQNAKIYLATTMETFGIGTVEAMAAGVPILGWRWGGTEDIVEHKVNGYLVEPEDYQGLVEGARYIHQHREEMGKAAREIATTRFSWKEVMAQYAKVFEQVLAAKRQETSDVSIVITNYNYKRWVGEAIHSAISQSHSPKEIIVVDDGSTDDSQKLIAAFADRAAAKGIEYKTIFQTNQGVAAARNHGIEASTSPFLTLLDADDRLSPEFIKKMLPHIIKDRSLGIVYSGLALLSEESALGIVSQWPPDFDWGSQSTPHVPPMNCIPSACLIRREMWERAGPIRQEYAPGEDTEFWTRGLSVGFNARKVTSEPLFHYRTHEGSASRTRKYISISDRMPWMFDKEYPLGAPTKSVPNIYSYALPKVSVIIPVGPGHERYVTQALDSLVGQTLREWEAIVVNDTGAPLELPQTYIFARVIDNPGPKHGAGIARNIGIEAAHAPTVFFLDADDLLESNALESLIISYVSYNGEKYIYSDWTAIEKDGERKRGNSKDYSQSQWRMFHPVSVLMSKTCAQKLTFDESLESWEDWEFFLRAAVNGICGARVPEPLLIYRLDSGKRRMKILNQDGSPNDLGSKVLAELDRRYGSYFTGDKIMTPCASCGGTRAAQDLIKVKERINRMLDNANPQGNVSRQQNIPDNNRVRLEFIGERVGATTFSVNGRTYRAGNNPIDKFIDVDPDDVAHLERMRVFRRVFRATPPVQQAAATDQGTPIPAAPPSPPDPAEVLMKARKDFENQQAEEDAKMQAAADKIVADIAAGTIPEAEEVEKAEETQEPEEKVEPDQPVKKSPASRKLPKKK